MPAVVVLAGATGTAAADRGLLLLAGDWCSKANSLEVFPA